MAFEKKMSGSLQKLNSEMGSSFVPKTISDILAQVSMIHDFPKMSNLDLHIHSLEQEMGKIDAFKSELPHSMQLLEDAIKILKGKMVQLKGREKRASQDINEKKKWMSNVQLWSAPFQYDNTPNHNLILPIKTIEEASGYGCNFNKSGGGALAPFQMPFITKEDKRGGAVPVAEVRSTDLNVKDASGINAPELQQSEPHRKQRRCWSSDLHNRFVDAVKQLGGPMAATPKQIREVMNHNGLTNDEVKSHLQKYRLHLRKHPFSSVAWLLNNERDIGEDGMSGNRSWSGRY